MGMTEALAVARRKGEIDRAVWAVSARLEARAMAMGRGHPLAGPNAALVAAEKRMATVAERYGVAVAALMTEARVNAEERLLARYGTEAACHETCRA